jgi:hypothetical protein
MLLVTTPESIQGLPVQSTESDFPEVPAGMFKTLIMLMLNWIFKLSKQTRVRRLCAEIVCRGHALKSGAVSRIAAALIPLKIS